MDNVDTSLCEFATRHIPPYLENYRPIALEMAKGRQSIILIEV